MDGYSNLALSPPTPTPTASGAPRAARPSMELTNTKETKAWEGLAIGAVTLARTFSTGSHRFCRSGSERRSRSRSRSGLLRRAFSMRRHPAGLLGAGDGYWRIHDMDGDSDRGGGGGTVVVEEHGEGEEEDEAAAAEEDVEKEKNKKTEQRDEDAAAGKGKEEAAAERRDKKRRGGIFKACKKLFRL